MTSSAVMTYLLAEPALAPLRRSFRYYYGNAGRAAAADELYRPFVGPRDLVFDIGAHVGGRTAAFRRLGARVVAVEPQPLCVRALRRIYGGDQQVVVIPAACGARTGILPLHVNTTNLTVSTLSEAFVSAAGSAPGWRLEAWDDMVAVRVLTLDWLIRRFGTPAFVKIDVEGYEDEVLAGLNTPVPALSFEYTTIRRDVSRRCLRLLDERGYAGYDVSPGDTLRLSLGRWATGSEVSRHLAALPDEANAGDVYAVSSIRAFTRQ